jgi:hypothetical protein
MKLLADCGENANARAIGGELIGGQLLTPLTGYSRWSETWAIDNGAYTRFDHARFKALLDREQDSPGCLWVAIPDVVGNARRTLELFSRRHLWVTARWPVALVAQDGLEDLDVPWDGIACLFVGGTTEWKNSRAVVDLIKTAKTLGKLVHIGRVNTPARWKAFESLGADTCDGSGLVRYDHMMQKVVRGQFDEQPLLEGQEVFA